MSAAPDATAAFHRHLQQEMEAFRFGLVLHLCRQRGYRVTEGECATLLAQHPDSLRQVLRQAGALDNGRRGLIAGLKQFFAAREKQWLRKDP